VTPSQLTRVVRWLAIAVAGVFAVATIFVAVIVPYRLWDSLAFGSWSRSIAKTGSIWSGTEVLNVSRPLFYVPQGLLWRFVTEDEWAGRLLSAAFAAVLVAAVWQLARELAPGRPAADLVPPLAVLTLLTSAELAIFAAAGMTDVPVAAASAATAVVVWSRLPPRALVPLGALGAAATILAKPSGLLALAGLAIATAALRGRGSVSGLTALAIGVGVGLAYDAWQAARLDVALDVLLRAGNDSFWLQRGAAARFDALVGAAWMGEGARLLVLYGLAYGVARAVGAGARVALGVGAAVAVVGSVVGPPVAGDGLGYPFDGHPLGIVAWIVLSAALVLAAFVADEDPTSRRVYVALLAWLAPVVLAWATQRPDEPRLLAPAWPALALLTGAALATASLALLRRRALVALVPAAAVALIALANVVSVDGLGRDGWRQLLDLGRAGWTDRAEMENFAYGPFSYQLNLARENVGDGDRIVSSDGRLRFFFPGQVEVRYARRCSELDGARFFSFLSSGESLEFAELEQQPTNALGWVQCPRPAVRLVGEQAGIYAAFVVGRPPARAPAEDDCHVRSTPGQLNDAVFGSDLGYAEASELVRRALEVGFQGARIERTNCETFRVVVTGVPDDPAVQEELRRETRSVGLDVSYAPAVRYPEVEAGVPPVER
jgi:hypothetical protein